MLLNIFFLLLGICTVRADSDVIPLDNTNFDQIVTADSGDWLIVFYAPWCQYCQSFMPTYETIAHDLLSNNPKISTAKVDVMGTGNRNLGTRFDIEAFPTFKLIHDGYTFTYQGPRTYDDIKNFATGGYKLYESTPTPGPAGLFGDIMRVYKVAWDNAIEDINAGHVFTLNVFVTVMPYLFVFIIILGNESIFKSHLL
jgi:protein disulfide-isomerase-like protein